MRAKANRSKIFRVANMGALTEAQLVGFLDAFERICGTRMKAIILAAGVGKRLWQVTQHRPKCLIEIGGQTLLHRYLTSLRSVGIHCADMVVGYKQEMIRAAVEANSCGVRVNFLVNEQFHRGSISSLWIARTALDDDAIVMDADVLFHQEILRRLVQSRCENALLMDETVKQTGEECMVVVEGGRVIALTKQMPLHYDSAGEGVGFLKVRHADARACSRVAQDTRGSRSLADGVRGCACGLFS